MLTVTPEVLDRIAEKVDLGRKSLQESVLERAELLPDDERMAFLLTIRGHLTREEVSGLAGVNKGTVTRRLQRASARLYDPVVVALSDPRCTLSRKHRDIGLGRLLGRRNIDDLAAEHHISSKQVRRMLDYVNGWYQGMRERKQGQG